MTFSQYRSMIAEALVNKFGSQSISDGNKSIKIKENTYHIQADVVPAFQLRNYDVEHSFAPDRYVEGIWFVSKKGEKVANYPKRHLRNGKDKNKATNNDYKKLVRIMKSVKNELVDLGLARQPQ